MFANALHFVSRGCSSLVIPTSAVSCFHDVELAAACCTPTALQLRTVLLCDNLMLFLLMERNRTWQFIWCQIVEKNFPGIWIVFTMDSSSVQQDVHLESRSSNGAPSSSEELLDCKAKLQLVTTDEINSKLFKIYQIISQPYPSFYRIISVIVQVKFFLGVWNFLYSSFKRVW